MSLKWIRSTILQQIDAIRKYQPRCGGRKLFMELKPFFKKHQIIIGRDLFFELLRTNKLLVRKTKRSVYTTNSKQHFRRYPNMIKDFTPLKAHELWVADITYIPLKNRFAYLFLITDAYSRKIIGFHVSDDMKVSSATLALKKAIAQKPPEAIVIHYSDTEGKPDWFFYACESYAKKGWVACAVEYRTFGREGTMPFEAVMDAKSAIRWLRQHANDYNIDTNKIIASGNSAGGHLVLCAALADKWNEKSDDLKFSSVPNILMVHSGVYDLTDQNTAWIRKDLKDKNLVKEISPAYLFKKNFPRTLIIHGTDDKNVSYSTAQKFVTEMKEAGNNTIEFESLTGAGHFIWYDPKYYPQVSKLRNEFLTKLGY